MSVRHIPESFEHTCDGCGWSEVTRNESRPKYWTTLIIQREAYDYQGNAVADGTIRRTLCKECSSVVSEAINASIRTQTEKAKSADSAMLAERAKEGEAK